MTTKVMAIINVNHDSFYPNSRFKNISKILYSAEEYKNLGASYIDIGAESSRPGAKDISLTEELERIIPVVEAITNNIDIKISIDTKKFSVMQEVIKYKIAMLNDINAFFNVDDINLLPKNIEYCIMHKQGASASMQDNPRYKDVVEDVYNFLISRAQNFVDIGFSNKNIYLDPGFGFGKTKEHNIYLFKNINKLVSSKYKCLIGVSNKTFIGQILANNSKIRDVQDRIYGSLACAMLLYLNKVDIIRVHNVKETIDTFQVLQSLANH